MAAPVYSANFIARHGLDGTATYTVPAGYVAILRDLDAYVAADITGSIDLFLVGHHGQTIFWATTDIDTTTVPQWRGRQLIPEGESFSVLTTGAADVTVSGYLLALP